MAASAGPARNNCCARRPTDFGHGTVHNGQHDQRLIPVFKQGVDGAFSEYFIDTRALQQLVKPAATVRVWLSGSKPILYHSPAGDGTLRRNRPLNPVGSALY